MYDLKTTLVSINKSAANEPNVRFGYSFEDVRTILVSTAKFNRTHTFKGILPTETILKLRAEGLAVTIDENNHTTVSWQ